MSAIFTTQAGTPYIIVMIKCFSIITGCHISLCNIFPGRKSQDVGISRAKAVYHVQPVGLPDSQKSHVVISDVVQAADQVILSLW